jgi:hypothetical protein
MLIGIACRNSSQRKSDNQTITTYDSVEDTNDWYNDGDDSKRLKLINANGKTVFLYENGEELFPCIFDSIVNVKGSTILNDK